MSYFDFKVRQLNLWYDDLYEGTQWRNVEGLAKKSPLGGKKSPLRGAPRSRVYLEQFVKKWTKNSHLHQNKIGSSNGQPA